MQLCKPAQVDQPCHVDQTQHPKLAQNNEKKHHFHFWPKHGTDQPMANKHQHVGVHPKHGNNEHKSGHGQAITNKHQHHVGEKPKHGNNEHKHGHGEAVNKQHHEASQGRSHKLRQCFGHGDRVASDVEETETVVIERKIEERVVISHVKKCHEHKEGANKHKEGAKHLDRC